jgi:hypothetical protein
MIRRREFIAGLGSAAAWPRAARAQQHVVPLIGVLSAQSAEVDYKDVTIPFLQGLKETGYSELSPKQLQLLRELIPNAAVFGVLVDPAFPDTQSVQIR